MTQLGSAERLAAPDEPDDAVQVLFRGVTHSEALERDLRHRAEALKRTHPDLRGCRVLLEQPHRQRHSPGQTFHVRIEMRVDDDITLVVTHESRAAEFSDRCAAAREAFEAARLQLFDLARREQHDAAM